MLEKEKQAMNIKPLILVLFVVACDRTPMPPPDAGLPEPVSIDAFEPDVWRAVRAVHPNTCDAPRVQTLDHADYLEVTTTCGVGACDESCISCTGTSLYDDVIVRVEPADNYLLAREVLTYVNNCDGSVFSEEEYVAVLILLRL